MRQSHLGEGAKKPEARNHPEGGKVDAAGVCSEGRASYPGRPASLPERATHVARLGDGSAGVSRGRSSRWKPQRRRAEPVMSGQSRVLSGVPGHKSWQGPRATATAASRPEVSMRCCGARWATGDTMHETKLAGARCPVDRNRRMPNGTYGGVGGRRG